MIKFILPLVIPFAASLVAILFLLRHKIKFPQRFGGAVIILVFIFFVIIDPNLILTKPIIGILVGSGLILLFGLWDDFKRLSWRWQLLFQIIIASIAVLSGVRSEYLVIPSGEIIDLHNPVIYFIPHVVYMLVFINSLNWLDGIDGLSGSVTCVALFTIFLLTMSLHVNQPAVAILCCLAGGATLGFLVFNWHPARILAGTSGAMFFGFILASLSVFAGAKIATVVAVAFIPVADLFWVILQRASSGTSIFSRDNRHIHYKLLELGIGEEKIVFGISLVTFILGVAALNLSRFGKMFMMVAIAFGYVIFRLKIIRKMELKNESR